jgi:hypothetical protein
VFGDSEAAALNKALFCVFRDEWETMNSTPSIEIVEEGTVNSDFWQTQFAKAKQYSMATVYVGQSRDGQTTTGPVRLVPTSAPDLNAFIKKQKKLAAKGRCLHFDSSGRCTDFVEAHSLQKNGLLREISRESHVYVPSSSIGSLKKTHGKLVMQKRGIGSVSTFPGFCGPHDSSLFKPIDTMTLGPTDEQIALYAYRALCREVFVKENSSVLIAQQMAEGHLDRGSRMLFDGYRTGTAIALRNLRRHKTHFDESFQAGAYQDVEYTLFAFKQKPFLAFSAVFYPEFDFLGRRLQNLADRDCELDLLTVCSAAMEGGWGLLLSWHKTSSTFCREFLGSLARVFYAGRGGEVALFRMVIASCENIAFAPDWWETQSSNGQERICSALSVDLFAPTGPDYLVAGLEGICDWEVDRVYSRIKD